MSNILRSVVAGAGALLIEALAAVAAVAAPSAPSSAEVRIAQAPGFCCVDGKLEQLAQRICVLRRGRYFDDAQQARRACVQTTQPVGTTPTGACCLDGLLESLRESECRERRGRFFDNWTEAERACGPEARPPAGEGVCCLEDRLEPMPEPLCRERRGRFFEDWTEAERACGPEARPPAGDGVCCLEDRLEPMPEPLCRERRGRFFEDAGIGRGQCRPQPPSAMGWCCPRDMFRWRETDCRESGGDFFRSEREARERCEKPTAPAPAAEDLTLPTLREHLARPGGNPPINEPASMSEMETVGDLFAHDLWGEDLARGEPLPLVDRDGEIVAYVFTYAMRTRRTPDMPAIASQLSELRQRFRGRTGESGPLPDDLATALERVAGAFGSVYVSASRNSPPVLGATYSLHPYFLQGEEVQAEAQRRMGGEKPGLRRVFFLGPDEEYFEFASPRQRVLLHTQSLHVAPAETTLNVDLPFRGSVDVQVRAREDWRRLLDLEPLEIPAAEVAKPHTETRITNWELIPVVDWTWWCVPTAQTMLVGFWDNYVKGVGSMAGYGKLVNYWFDHSSGSNTPDFLDRLIDPATKTWRQAAGGGGYTDLADFIQRNYGYSFTSPSTSASSASDYGWSLLTSEIAAGRPLVWATTTPNHSSLAFGYHTNSTGKFVVIYSTWGKTAAQQLRVWSHTLGQGFLRLIPSGTSGYDNLLIVAPDGGESLDRLKPTDLRWAVSGSQIKTVDVDFSTDGGKTWSVVLADYPTTTGNTTYKWLPAVATTAGRIRLRGKSQSGSIVAADGSHANFTVSSSSLDSWNAWWTTLGNPLQSATATGGGIETYDLGRNSDGRLQVFAALSDGTIRTAYESGGAWTGWTDLGKPSGNVFLRQPAVGSDESGLLQVFALGDDSAVWTSHQSSAIKPKVLSPWESLGKPSNQKPLTLSVSANQDGSLEAFVLAVDGVWHARRVRSSRSGWSWGAWQSLGKPSGASLYTLTVGRNKDGSLELFSGGGSVAGEFGLSNAGLWRNRQSQANATNWGTWESLGSPTHKSATYPAAGTNEDGRLELFGVGNDGALWHMPQLTPSGSWGKWWTLNAPAAGTKLLSHTAVSTAADGRLEVFAIGMSGTGSADIATQTWHIFQKSANNGWDTWTGLGAVSGSGPGVSAGKNFDSLRVGVTQSGKLEVFAIDQNTKSLWRIWQK